MSSSDSSWGMNSAFCLSKLFQSKERKNRCCLTSYAPPWGREWRGRTEGNVLNDPPSKGKNQFQRTPKKRKTKKKFYPERTKEVREIFFILQPKPPKILP